MDGVYQEDELGDELRRQVRRPLQPLFMDVDNASSFRNIVFWSRIRDVTFSLFGMPWPWGVGGEGADG